MMTLKTLITTVAASLVAISSTAQNEKGTVKMYEGTLTLPTYEVAAPEKAPSFSRNFAYQRARRSIYPYPMYDNVTNNCETVDHKALYLENDYIELCVLPDIGGRLFYAIDKTNGYDIFYHQHVIKPSNVGMLGAWISGGVEFNVFHHHRASSHLPVDYKLVDNEDGSKTIWVGETEPRQRMSWAIGLTLYPDKSYIEVSGKLINCTENKNSILYWSNVSTSVNETYQIIFPENTDFAMFHAKNSFARWPITDDTFNKIDDYKNGINASWWKNHINPISFFAYNLQDDFIAGYDHGKNAGTMLIGNHNINKGGKLFEWGSGAYGHKWDSEVLTDSDGPYCELMVSAYSDNQPDYCWLNPYEVKEFTSYWYGIRNLGNVKEGNEYASLNMEFRPKEKVFIAANTTSAHKGATVKVTGPEGKELYSEKINIAPDAPYSHEFTASEEDTKDITKVVLTIYDEKGEELLSYRPYIKDLSKPLPETVKPPKRPQEIENTEELYFVGLRNLQFHNAHIDAIDYFNEVLRRDASDTRANTQVGIYYRERGEYEKAASYLRTAIKRMTKDYTRPRDAEAMYNLGLILKLQGKTEDAIDTLYRAAWDYNFMSPAYFELAQISVAQGNYPLALQQLDMSLRSNVMNLNSRNLRATILRHIGKDKEALSGAKAVLAIDPINFYATYEADRESFKSLLRNQPESYIEVALEYLSNGFEEEALDIFNRADQIKAYPTVKYYLGYLADKRGDRKAATDYFAAAAALSIDYCFPYRLETINVLEKALEYMPNDANTCYYLGNLLFDKQPDAAMGWWMKAVELNPDFAMAYRNLGWGYKYHLKDYALGAEYYEKAIQKDNTQATFFTELDDLYEHAGGDVKHRMDLLTSNHNVVKNRYDSFVREIRMLTCNGEYDKAIGYLTDQNNFFGRQEGVDDLHDIYVDACLLAGAKALNDGNAAKAVEYFKKADEYPDNQNYPRLEYYARNSQVYYMTGVALEKAGKKSEAKKYYKKASENETRNTEFNYEKTLAAKKLNQKADVSSVFSEVLKTGENSVTDRVENFFVSFSAGKTEAEVNSQAYYVMGLGYLGLGNNDDAKRCFAKACEIKPDNIWAAYRLEEMK